MVFSWVTSFILLVKTPTDATRDKLICSCLECVKDVSRSVKWLVMYGTSMNIFVCGNYLTICVWSFVIHAQTKA